MTGKIRYMLILTSVLLFITASHSFSQGFGSNPPFQDWKSINTKNFEIIFPVELESEAQRVANTLEYTFPFVCASLNAKPPKTSVLLTNKGVVPNGYVRLAPRMSEWFSSPPQSSSIVPLLGTGDWYNILASHEMRHAVQYHKLNKGFTMIMYILLGDIGRSLMTNLSMPGWVFEGDAVATETALSNSGRGRLPSYDMEIRALELSDERYSYYKAWLGSYDEHYPDIYHLGYLLTTYIRRHHGANALEKAMDKSGKLSIWPFIFTNALKSKTKSSANQTYHKAMDELKTLWYDQLANLDFTEASIINKRKSDDWVSYYYPQYVSDGSIYAIKHSKSIPTTLVKINKNGEEQEIQQISTIFPSLKAKNDLICWNDIGWDLRWSSRTYSELLTLNSKSNSIKRITHKSRYFTPSPSSDNRKIVAVYFAENRDCRLIIADSKTGKEIKSFVNPGNYYISSPCWSDDGKSIAYLKQKFNGKSLALIDVESGNEKELIPEDWENISDPIFYKDFIIFGSTYSGIDNIYAININTKEQFQVTSRKFGAFNPSVSHDGLNMIFNDYTVKGYDIAEMPLNPEKWVPLSNIEKRNIKYYQPLVEQEQGRNVFDEKEIPKNEYKIKNYYPALNLFNVHSWQFMPSTYEPFIQLLSSDVLGTTNLTAGIGYNSNEKALGWNAGISYAGFFPIFSLGVGYTGRSLYGGTTENRVVKDSWIEKTANFGITLPFNLSKGIMMSMVQLSATGEFLKIEGRQDDWNGILFPVEYKFEFMGYRKMAERDIKPRIGTSIFASITTTPFKDDLDGSRISAQTKLYFPGFFKNHSIEIGGYYELQKPIGYQFGSYFLYPRGYNSTFYPNLYKASIDYTFPIFYPDLAIGQLLYFKRLRGNFFVDLGEGRNKQGDFQQAYKSFGAELTIDYHLFGWIFEINTGVRFSIMPQDKTNKTDLIFNFGL